MKSAGAIFLPLEIRAQCAAEACCAGCIRRHGCELRMKGTDCSGAGSVHGDNQPVLANTVVHSSQFKRKSGSVARAVERFAQAAHVCAAWHCSHCAITSSLEWIIELVQ